MPEDKGHKVGPGGPLGVTMNTTSLEAGMATETLTELELFHRFLAKEIGRGNKRMTPQESIEKFEAYRRDVRKLQELLQPAFEQCERGECGPIDWDEFFREAEERLRGRGVPG